jgi:hypothetical protein
MTIDTGTSLNARRRPQHSITGGEAHSSRACRCRQVRSRRAKPRKDHRTRAAAIANDENHRLEKADLTLHQQTRKSTKSEDIRRTHDSTLVVTVADAENN